MTKLKQVLLHIRKILPNLPKNKLFMKIKKILTLVIYLRVTAITMMHYNQLSNQKIKSKSIGNLAPLKVENHQK